jgi:hypothetical protein
LFGDAFGLFFHFSWNPLREWNLPAHVVPGRRVLFSNLRNPSRRESVGYSDQRWPKTAMDESKLSVDKTTYQDIFRIRHCLKYRKDMMTFRVSPPASFDGLVDNRLGKSGNGAFA